MKTVISKHAYRLICAMVQVAIAVLIFISFYKWHVADTAAILSDKGPAALLVAIYLLMYVFIGRTIHAFMIGVEQTEKVAASHVIAFFINWIIEVFATVTIIDNLKSFWYITGVYLLMTFIQSIISLVFVFSLTKLYHHLYPPLRLLMIYGDYENEVEDKMNSLTAKFHIEDSMSYREGLKAIKRSIGNYDAVLINDIPAKARNKVLKICFDMDKRVYFVPTISDVIIRSAEDMNLLDTPLYLCRNSGITAIEAIIKRFFDILISVIALIVLSPLMLIVAAAVKLEDKGPVFFCQERVTIGGRVFKMIKFRSMYENVEESGVARPAGENDDRITKVGRIIRTTRIDELPQLINIIKGDMSIVGPRPDCKENIDLFTREIPEFVLRTKVKAGLTGYAQVYGKYSTYPLDKLKMDVYYIMNYSLLLDFRIIVETLKIVFQKDSAQGLSEKRIEKFR